MSILNNNGLGPIKCNYEREGKNPAEHHCMENTSLFINLLNVVINLPSSSKNSEVGT